MRESALGKGVFVMPSRVQFSGRDYGNEITRLALVLGDVTGANYDARVASIAALLTAINDVCVSDAGFNGQQFNAIDIPLSGKHAQPTAQRERKWRVPLIDGINPLGNWSFEIGMADAGLLVTDGELMNVAGGDGLALVQALQTHCVSRLGNAVTVGPITLVGRST